MDWELLRTQATLVLDFIMLLTTLGISTSAAVISASITVKEMISLYRAQATVLCLITLLTAFKPSPNPLLIAVALIPLLLAAAVNPLLGRATLANSAQTVASQDGGLSQQKRIRRFIHSLLNTPREATLTWLQHGRSRRGTIFSVALDLVLVIIAFVLAYQLARPSASLPDSSKIDSNSLGVVIALLLLGLSTMNNKQDIIAQIIGLLVMEHGLFLAAVKIIAIPALAPFFGLSLFVYTVITLLILVWILPELHRLSGSIDVDEQRQLQG